MGVEYYLVDKKNKIFYDLGKGGLSELRYDFEALQDLEYLENYILEDCFQVSGENKLNYLKEDDIKETIEYVKNRLAPDLFNHFGQSDSKDLSIINDCTDDLWILKCKKYKCIGTRYYRPGSLEHNEEIARLNKHLEDTENNKKWYNPDEAKKYAEYNNY